MVETSMPWNGTTIGDATTAPYDAPDEFAQLVRAWTRSNEMPNRGGIFQSIGTELVPAVVGAVSPVNVGTGEALCHGTFYSNSAVVAVPIPNSVASRYDLIVIRKDWALQTVRITRIAGVEGGIAPAIVQIAGTTWDIPICTVRIQVAALTITADDRQYFPYQVPLLQAHQGVDPIDWGSRGVGARVNYPLVTAKSYVGIVRVPIAAGDDYGEVQVDFPETFSGDPYVLVGISNDVGGVAVTYYAPNAVGIDDDHFHAWVSRPSGVVGDTTVAVTWLAVGPY